MNSIKKIIDLFSEFPTIGPRTARRFAYYLICQPKEKVSEIANAILELKNNIKLCSFCLSPFEPANKENNLCPICAKFGRNKNILCIIEKEQDLEKIEETGKYNGLYFIFGKLSSSFANPENETLKIESLRQRILYPEKFGINDSKINEIIIATNPTPEGISTCVVIERSLKEINKNNNIRITRLARGIPMGGELEYADQETLESAIEGRK